MNRHNRRAQAAQNKVLPAMGKALEGLKSLNDLGTFMEQLRPMLEHAEQLSGKLNGAYILLQESTAESERLRLELRHEIELQRHITLHLIADVGRMTLQEILTKEQNISELLLEATSKEQNNADTITRDEIHGSEADHPSS